MGEIRVAPCQIPVFSPRPHDTAWKLRQSTATNDIAQLYGVRIAAHKPCNPWWSPESRGGGVQACASSWLDSGVWVKMGTWWKWALVRKGNRVGTDDKPFSCFFCYRRKLRAFRVMVYHGPTYRRMDACRWSIITPRSADLTMGWRAWSQIHLGGSWNDWQWIFPGPSTFSGRRTGV